MYKGKPVIVGERPWYRHPIFPWGWYSIIQDSHRIKIKDKLCADGYYEPNDGGGGEFTFHSITNENSHSESVKFSTENQW